jgi:hypothetical protein
MARRLLGARRSMMDAAYLGLTVLFFALSLALVEFCDRL